VQLKNPIVELHAISYRFFFKLWSSVILVPGSSAFQKAIKLEKPFIIDEVISHFLASTFWRFYDDLNARSGQWKNSVEFYFFSQPKRKTVVSLSLGDKSIHTRTYNFFMLYWLPIVLWTPSRLGKTYPQQSTFPPPPIHPKRISPDSFWREHFFHSKYSNSFSNLHHSTSR
jgi:hypothetical protein